ncbi:hypothetical protein CWE22_08630 [Pseudidiomarina aestuarii]|uniref:Uncharacterized protein n=1 Tax=Pseudidiomarina aestuarii TaxID=624146 RepID=A0A7Z6ZWB1_9GAMM|nr:hypothetical protein CWE22_08630 [Pseudidiomarina aestuarii]
MKRANGFYFGSVIGFLSYLINESFIVQDKISGILSVLIESLFFGLFVGILMMFGLSALAGRAHSDTNCSSDFADLKPNPKKEIHFRPPGKEKK